MSKFQISNFKFQKGQTLIETLAALFILAMGISAAVGLAVYAFNSSTSITKEIIGTGLAREGLEAVRNMRDTNWLQDTLAVNGCYDYVTSTNNNANCYTHWLNETFCLDPNASDTSNACATNGTVGNAYLLGFDYTTPNFWILKKETSHYGLNFDSANAGNSGFYYPGSGNSGVACTSSNSGYCRKIIITALTPSGSVYDPATYGGAENPGPLLEVQSQVWWTDKKCPAVNNWPGTGTCSVELDTYLTNWRNY
jgi:Tfp pilus assembly protein PilV